MALLQPNEYDISYFDGKKSEYSHNAGYTQYERWARFSNDFLPLEQSTGDYWKDLALRFNLDHSLQNKKVLEIGCAKGFVVEALRDLGIDAYGIDISQYAIDCAREDIKPYLTVADARTHLSTYANGEFDVVFTRRTLCCFSDAEISALVTQLNRIASQQVHLVYESENPTFYNPKPIQELVNGFNWKKRTIFVAGKDITNVVRK
jgi:SAM-dependent methyltransferase